jgi:hypothetical protein
VQSPDGLVFINGEADILGCGQCRRRFDWNKYITSIQVDLNIDSPPGSASINMSLPRHSVDEFYTDGNPLITPMMEIEIFAKGAFTVEGLPQYYPIFWGMVTEVSDSYSGGEHTFSINCSDILKWWEVCMMNINPAFTAPQGAGQLGRSLFGNVLQGSNPYDVIWHMAQQSFGDIVVGSGSLVSLYKENQQKQTFNAALSDIMGYWESRFKKIRSNLLLYGSTGNVVRGDVLVQQYADGKQHKNLASSAVRQANGGKNASQMVYDPTDPQVVAMRTQFSQAGVVNFWSSEYQTKLEIANTAKEAVGYEFYMDVTGDIVFKPPFYNLDVLSNKPISWIQDIDIIDWDLSESEAEVVTQVQIQGSFGGNTDYGFGEETTPFTSVTDYHLLRQYGWRTQSINSEFLGAPLLMFYVGLDMLDRLNARRHRGTVNIPLRPELRLGFPIYLAPKDQIWYIQGLSHNIQFGGRAQTTVTMTAKRSKFLAPKGIGTIDLTSWAGGSTEEGAGKPLSSQDPKPTSRQLKDSAIFKVNVGEAAQLPPSNYPDGPDENNPYAPLILRHPKTGRVVGYPNVVLAYTRPFQPPPDKLLKTAGQSPTSQRSDYPSKLRQQVEDSKEAIQLALMKRYEADLRSGTWEKHNVNRYTYGLNSAGVYMYLHDKSYNNEGVIKDVVIMKTDNIQVENQEGQQPFQGANAMIRPVSDERGFEVVGHHRYGRGVSLRDGSLVLTPEGTNTRANIGTQMALAGGLYDMIKAQASGLATISTTAPNPIDAVVSLQPEDLQTAGVVNQDTESPEWVTAGVNFVDVAPLGSPEQKGADPIGVGNVEASQLSRALTIAEMGVREAIQGAGQNCSCLTGRPDLTFVLTGFQIKTVRETPEDTTSFSFGAAPAANDIRAIADEEGEFVDIGSADLVEALQDGTPVAGEALALNREDLSNVVENFLTSLYSALDTPHQEYEQAIRGETLTRQNPTDVPKDVHRFGARDDSTFEPPFNAMGRERGGDPAAIALRGSTAREDAEKAWDKFGEDLSKQPEIAELKIEIQAIDTKISLLETEYITASPARRQEIDEEIAELQQERANLQKKLDDLLAD